MRKVFLNTLPKNKNGNIQWNKINNNKVKFIYNDIEGELLVKKSLPNRFVLVEYNGDEIELQRECLRKGHIGKALGTITKEFKFKIGDRLTNYGRNLTILDRFYNVDGIKYYKVLCNKCNYIHDKSEYHLIEQDCPCCKGQVVVKGINDIATTNPEIFNLLVNKEDGYNYSATTSKKLKVKCPNCGKEKYINIYNLIRQGVGCAYCSDGISYPNKFMGEFFNQLKEKGLIKNYILEKSYKINDKTRRYDIFATLFNGEKIICENNGIQHYKEIGYKVDLKTQQIIDNEKKNYALNILKVEHYISLDCRESNFTFMKNSILNSELNNIFDLANIDWELCEKMGRSNKKELILNYYMENPTITIKELAKKFNTTKRVIYDYFKLRGIKLNTLND